MAPPVASTWTNYLSCPCCNHEYDDITNLPISLDCGHTICKPCLVRLNKESKPCPFDSKDMISTEMLDYPVNTALLAVTGLTIRTELVTSSVDGAFSDKKDQDAMRECMRILQNFSQYLPCKPTPPPTSTGYSNQQYTKEMSSCAYMNSAGVVCLSRPMQKKILSVVTCQLATTTGRERPNDQFAVMMAASDERFRQEYRMSRGTFMEVFRRIEPRLQRVNLFGDVVEPMKRLAICLARLVRGSYYHEIGELYGVGECTASTICNDVSRIIVELLWEPFVTALRPTTAEEMAGLQRHMDFPFAFAAVEKLARSVRALGVRCITELILQHQDSHQLSGNLWGAVRSRGCQFLGPAMQEEVLRLILVALEDGSPLSRKVLVLFVVQRLTNKYPQASKTAIGHVVQLLYRASCFKVTKRDNESSLMQLKEEYCKYEPLRQEHDKQIVQIAHEAGLRIAPDQWSSLLYGDTYHKPRMQSIIDKLQTPQTFSQSIAELMIALQRTNDPAKLSRLEYYLQQVASLTEGSALTVVSAHNCLESTKIILDALTDFVRSRAQDKLNFGTIVHPKYKSAMCRDLKVKGTCPRGPNCTFAHNESELEKPRDAYNSASTEDLSGSAWRRSDSESDASVEHRPQLHHSVAVVSPNSVPRRPPTEIGAPAQATHPPGHQGAYYYVGSPADMPPQPIIMSPVSPSQVPTAYYPTGRPVTPVNHANHANHAMMAGPPMQPPPVMEHPPHGHMIPPRQPYGGYVSGHHGGAGGDMYMPGPPSYPPAPYYGGHYTNYHPPYYNRHAPAPHPTRHTMYMTREHPPYHQVGYHGPPPTVREDYYDRGYGHGYMPEETFHPPGGYYPQNYPPGPPPPVPRHAGRYPAPRMGEANPNMHDEPLYEYYNKSKPEYAQPVDNTVHQTLVTLKKRRDAILEKIQVNQIPTDDDNDPIKTEISMERIEDLAYSLAISMNAGQRPIEMTATIVNSMLATSDKPSGAQDTISTARCHTQPIASSTDSREKIRSSVCENMSSRTYYNSLSSSSAVEYIEPQDQPQDQPQDYNEVGEPSTSEGDNVAAWTSWSGLTSSNNSSMALSEEFSSLLKYVSRDSISSSSDGLSSTAYTTYSQESVIPWGEKPYISKFGPICRNKGNIVSVTAHQKHPTNSEDRDETKPHKQSKDAILVNSKNALTVPVTAVTPVRRPIPSPSLAFSKFKALPNETDAGFTVTSEDTDGSSSIAESRQLAEELKILNNKIDKVEAQAACEELTDIERNIRRLEIKSKASSRPQNQRH